MQGSSANNTAASLRKKAAMGAMQTTKNPNASPTKKGFFGGSVIEPA